MNPTIQSQPKFSTSSQSSRARTLLGAAILFCILQFGITWVASYFDFTWSAFIITPIVVSTALILESILFKRTGQSAWHALGFGLPNLRAILAAGLIALALVAFFPVYFLLTGTTITLRSDWLWLLLGIVIFNGFAEETLFRGYVFGGLRLAGNSYRRAGWISLIIFAAVHLLLFIQNPFIVALLGTSIAIAAAFPMAFLYERGNNTLWATVILHVSAHFIRLVDIPEPDYMLAVTVWLVLQMGVVFLVYVFKDNLLKTS